MTRSTEETCFLDYICDVSELNLLKKDQMNTQLRGYTMLNWVFHCTKSSIKVLKNFASSLSLPGSSDQDTVSPYKINTIPSRQLMRINTNINQKIITWSNTKFSKLTEHQKNCMTVS